MGDIVRARVVGMDDLFAAGGGGCPGFANFWRLIPTWCQCSGHYLPKVIMGQLLDCVRLTHQTVLKLNCRPVPPLHTDARFNRVSFRGSLSTVNAAFGPPPPRTLSDGMKVWQKSATTCPTPNNDGRRRRTPSTPQPDGGPPNQVRLWYRISLP